MIHVYGCATGARGCALIEIVVPVGTFRRTRSAFFAIPKWSCWFVGVIAIRAVVFIKFAVITTSFSDKTFVNTCLYIRIPYSVLAWKGLIACQTLLLFLAPVRVVPVHIFTGLALTVFYGLWTLRDACFCDRVPERLGRVGVYLAARRAGLCFPLLRSASRTFANTVPYVRIPVRLVFEVHSSALFATSLLI